MNVRVRNLQPRGGSALPVGGFSIEPGWTSPIIDVEEGSPLEEILTNWSEDGIALVLPVDLTEEGGTTGATHKKRKVQVLNLDQAREEAKRRDAMRRTSLDASEIPAVPALQRDRQGRSSLKGSILSVDKVPSRRGAHNQTALSQEKLDDAMEKLGSNPPPGEKDMMPPPPAVEPPKGALEDGTPLETPPSGPSEPDPDPVKVEEEDPIGDEETADEAKRAEMLKEYINKIDDLKKSDILVLCEKLGIEEAKSSMLKSDLAQAAASHLIAEDIDINDVIE